MLRLLMHAQNWLNIYVAAVTVTAIMVGIWSGYLKSRKIQPRGFRWRMLRNEIIVAILGGWLGGLLVGLLKGGLTRAGLIQINTAHAAWYVIAIEFTVYFFAFDTWFYWLHRWMHKEPIYTWVHKVHHWSTAPNPITTFSVTPLESLINGGFVPLFLAAVTVHQQTLALILPTNIIMGLYVHTGYEFLPRWWNRSWATKWFITTTFHDEHHKYFSYNFGGYTTIWDRLCGTMRRKYEVDFERPRLRSLSKNQTGPVVPAQVGAEN